MCDTMLPLARSLLCAVLPCVVAEYITYPCFALPISIIIQHNDGDGDVDLGRQVPSSTSLARMTPPACLYLACIPCHNFSPLAALSSVSQGVPRCASAPSQEIGDQASLTPRRHRLQALSHVLTSALAGPLEGVVLLVGTR